MDLELRREDRARGPYLGVLSTKKVVKSIVLDNIVHKEGAE